MSVCSINGRQISVIDGEVYVDGVHYVPEGEANSSNSGPFKPGKMVDHIFDVSSDFSTIVSRGFMDVVFRQSDKAEDFQVKGHLPENLIEKLNVYVEDDTLFISIKSGVYDLQLAGNQIPTIYVTNKVLKDVMTNGSGDFTIEGDFKAASGGFSVHGSGSSDFKAHHIDAKKTSVSLSTSGSGDINIDSADCRIFMINISGSADVDCGEITSEIASINIKGSGDVSISGKTDSVEFSIAGSGDIRAGGFKAKTGKASVAGSGDITCNVERLSDRVRGSGDIHNRY